MTAPRSPRLIVRVFVNRKLQVTHEIDPANAELLGEIHAEIAARAGRAGRTWLVEVENPVKPKADRYVRFGTDPASMTAPNPAGFGDLYARLDRLLS